MSIRMRRVLPLIGAMAIGISGASCGYLQNDSQTEEQKRERAQKTRDEVAKATERAKPELQKAGRELKEAAKTAAEQAHAAAQGVREGWEKGSTQKLDLNSATESELARVPGITRRDAHKIVAARPYSSPHELVEKGIVSEQRYSQMRSQITVR
jgi:DNA uptake protein ComE-like DNA-binding protein